MYPNLEAEMKRNKKNNDDLAKLLDLNVCTVSCKLNGKNDFKLSEMQKIRNSWFQDCTLDYLSENVPKQE